MKKTILFIFILMSLAACVKDDSTYGNDQIYIRITGLSDSYHVTSFTNAPFSVAPTVESSFAENDLEYKWFYFKPQKTSQIVDGKYMEIHAKKIADTRQLDYHVALSDGTYVFVLVVTSKSTGYSRNVKTSVHVASLLAKGFVILKETADGNTDYDVYNNDKGELINDVLTKVQGKPLLGKPRALDVNYGKEYLDQETGRKESANLICVTTEADKVAWIRAMDGEIVMDNSNCFYETVTGVIPYRSFSGMFNSFYVTGNGIYGAGHGGFAGGSGIFGPLSGNGGSTHVITIPSLFSGMLFWNEQQHAIQFTDYNNGNHAIESTAEGYTVINPDYDCLSCGVSCAGGETIYFLLQRRDNPSQKRLYYIACPNRTPTLTQVRTLDPDTHFSKATCRAVNANIAVIAYGVDANKVYSFDLAGTSPEKELLFSGLPSDEQITYLSNRYLKGDDGFDYLIVGTQKDNTYKLRMYKIVGGEPDGAPAIVIEGKGKLKGVDYLSPTVGADDAYQMAPTLDQ
ncbi:hypothetical protein JHU38_02255 [Prevotella sp. A2931]|uniref:Lipoprotein n=1 Tax=Prevotella illustrans TaxID=2800387 RepID=A0ABS3M350_9BACT|nr:MULTISPECIES: PKD-like family lipoprotein [Prevotella]MBO1362610.1 hypothetical protein [Prevotella illustrans]PTL25215.1 hypothetical protein C3V39_11010 [Prevotella sp. oral taxon 820]